MTRAQLKDEIRQLKRQARYAINRQIASTCQRTAQRLEQDLLQREYKRMYHPPQIEMAL